MNSFNPIQLNQLFNTNGPSDPCKVPTYEAVRDTIVENKMHEAVGYMIEANQNRTRITRLEAYSQIKRALTNLEEKKGEAIPKADLYRFCDKPHIHITLRLQGSVIETAQKAAELFAGKFYRDFSTIEAVLEKNDLSLSREHINSIIETLPDDSYCLTEESKQPTNAKNMVKLPDQETLGAQLNNIFHSEETSYMEYRNTFANFFGGKTYASKSDKQKAFENHFQLHNLLDSDLAKEIILTF